MSSVKQNDYRGSNLLTNGIEKQVWNVKVSIRSSGILKSTIKLILFIFKSIIIW
jgi:hypothetical protein